MHQRCKWQASASLSSTPCRAWLAGCVPGLLPCCTMLLAQRMMAAGLHSSVYASAMQVAGCCVTQQHALAGWLCAWGGAKLPCCIAL